MDTVEKSCLLACLAAFTNSLTCLGTVSPTESWTLLHHQPKDLIDTPQANLI